MSVDNIGLFLGLIMALKKATLQVILNSALLSKTLRWTGDNAPRKLISNIIAETKSTCGKKNTGLRKQFVLNQCVVQQHFGLHKLLVWFTLIKSFIGTITVWCNTVSCTFDNAIVSFPSWCLWLNPWCYLCQAARWTQLWCTGDYPAKSQHRTAGERRPQNHTPAHRPGTASVCRVVFPNVVFRASTTWWFPGKIPGLMETPSGNPDGWWSTHGFQT